MENQNDLSQQSTSTVSPPEPKRYPFLSKTAIILVVSILILFSIIYIGISSTLNKRVAQITNPQTISPNTSYPTPTPTTISQPSPTAIDETVYTGVYGNANWKTYTNKDFNFSLNLPSDWQGTELPELSDRPPSYNFHVPYPSRGIDESEFLYWHRLAKQELPNIGINVSTDNSVWRRNHPNESLETFFNKFYAKENDFPLDSYGCAGKVGNTTVDGVAAVRTMSCYTLEPTVSLSVSVYKKPFYYEITTGRGDGLVISDQQKKIFDQILSTFKFTGQNPTSETNKFCQTDSDCSLKACAGCFNKDWSKTSPPDLACIQYSEYSCKCINNTCTEIKPNQPTSYCHPDQYGNYPKDCGG